MPATAQRRLVKSPPELWSEISDAQSLAKRLSALGEVRITRIEPETTVAWEGASIRGTVELEASGWGTKVTITAEREAQARAAPEPEPAFDAAQDTQPFDSASVAAVAAKETSPETEPEPEATGTDIPPQAPSPAPREDGFLARLKGWWHTGRWAARQPDAVSAPTPAAAETLAKRTELQPPRPGEPTPTPAAAETPAKQTELQPPRPPALSISAPEVEPDVRAGRTPAPAPAPARDPELEGMLVGILDDLGAAHHRPFSRA